MVGGSGSRSSGWGSVADILRRGNRGDRGGIEARARLRPAMPTPRSTTPKTPMSASSSRLGPRGRARLAAGGAVTVCAVGGRRSTGSARASTAGRCLAIVSPAGAADPTFERDREALERAARARVTTWASTRVPADAGASAGEAGATASERPPPRPRVTPRGRPADGPGCTSGGAAPTGCAAEGTAGASCSTGPGWGWLTGRAGSSDSGSR